MITTNQTNWAQFSISLFVALLGSVFIIYLMFNLFQTNFSFLLVKLRLKYLKKKTGRNILFIKHTTKSLFGGSLIDSKTLQKISEALNKFDGKDFDLIIHSHGGEIFSTMFIVNLFKE